MDFHKKFQAAQRRRSTTVLQRFWQKVRDTTTSQVVKQFAASGLDGEYVRSIGFDSLVVFLREKSVITVSKECLQRIHMMTTFRHGLPSDAPQSVKVRTFLAGYMIAYYPTRVFESMDTLEQALYDASVPMLTAFEQIWKLIHAGTQFSAVPHDLTKDFQALLFRYLKCFGEWKVPDQRNLQLRITHALAALYEAEARLPPEEREDSKLRVQFRAQIQELRAKLLQVAGPDALRAFDENPRAPGASLPRLYTNEQLAHELLLDPTFQLEEYGGRNNLELHHTRDMFQRAFWESLVDDLQLATPCYSRVLHVLGEIRNGVANLQGPNELDEVIDLNFIKEQAEAGLYDWNSCRGLMDSIITVIKRVQAPKREAETTEKWRTFSGRLDCPAEERPRVLSEGMELLLDRLNTMRIDAANARLRLIARSIADTGVDYERGHFEKKLKDGKVSLERATEWLGTAIRQEVERNEGLRASLVDGSASAFLHVHSAAMLALVTEPIDGETYPETLLLDVHRLSSYQEEFRQQTTAAALYVMASQMLQPGAALSAIASLMRTEGWVPTVEAIEGVLVEHNRADGALLKALRQSFLPTDGVHRLIGTRLRALWWRKMRGEQPCAFSHTIEPLVPRIEKAVAKLTTLACVNRAVHAPIYNEIIRAAVAV